MPPRGPKINKSKEVSIYQSFVDDRYPALNVRTVPESQADSVILDWLVQNAEDNTEIRFIGVHPSYTKLGLLAALAICIGPKVILLTDIMKGRSHSHFRRMFESKLLGPLSGYSVVAFDGHEVALTLYKNMGLRCTGVIDILSLPPRNRDVVQTAKRAIGVKVELFHDAIRDAFLPKVHDKDVLNILAQKAWFAYFVADHPEARKDLATIPVINSSIFAEFELDELCRNMEGLLISGFGKPSSETYDLPSGKVTYQGSKVSWDQSTYGKRLRNQPHQVVKAHMHDNVTLSGGLVNTKGKRAVIKVQNLDGVRDPKIQSITVTAGNQPTKAEQQQSLNILLALQKKLPLFEEYWIKRLYLSSDQQCDTSENFEREDNWAESWGSTDHPWGSPIVKTASDGGNAWSGSDDNHWTSKKEPNNLMFNELVYTGPLNNSQKSAINNMLDLNKDISIIQGPPGTGKTTVIAAYIAEVLSQSDAAYLIVSQSNVAIKNVAEKLCYSGISEWKLIVSSEFLTGWHEHLYQLPPENNILSSAEIKQPLQSRVVLCTLSMLSSSQFQQASRKLHFSSVIIDEASQISMSHYMPMLVHFGKHIKKLIFIGDDKQLPPYSSETAKVLNSIFENKSLLETTQVEFLNMQYRMPTAIGDFISKEVYLNMLHSWNDHPVQSSLAVQFIDVQSSEEPEKTSFKNSVEAAVVITIATLLSSQCKEFKVITPYEPQRDLLEYMLYEAGLPWMNICFTVDSFQGNEGDYIIISTVRTRSIGFLQDLRRSNVMLTRAKRGMFICTNRSLLQSPAARYTLLGKMAEEWAGVDGGWVEDINSLAEKLYVA